MDCSVNGPQKLGNVKQLDVWFEGNGSSSVSVYEGQGVCYNWDYGTAASADARRYNRVELPTILNAPYFAGVLACNYTIPKGGRVVTIYAPGSVCNILSKVSSTIGVGRVTCQAGGTYAGYFTAEGFAGQGSAKPLQTVDRSVTAGVCLAVLEEGPQSGLQEILTVTAGGATTMMVGGVTHFATATLAGDATFTIAAGTMDGQKKKWIVDGTQTTNNVVITYGGTAKQADNSTTLAAVTLDDTGDETLTVWQGYWRLLTNVGSVLS